MSRGLIFGIVMAIAIGAVVWFAVRGQGRDQRVSSEIDRTVMADYCRLVGQARFAEAWETCLSAGYRRDVPRERFVTAHNTRRTDVGSLGGCRLLRADLNRNLFSRTRELHLLYELDYSGRIEREYATVSDADGVWRISGTYHLNAGDTYDFLLW
jgi:hypothetical protein